MATMTRMAKAKRIPDDGKLSARVPPIVREEVEVLLARLTSRYGYRFRASALGIEGLVGSVVVDFLEKPIDVQRAVLDRRPRGRAGEGQRWRRAHARNRQRAQSVVSSDHDATITDGLRAPPARRL